jgi:hypothetical protein
VSGKEKEVDKLQGKNKKKVKIGKDQDDGWAAGKEKKVDKLQGKKVCKLQGQTTSWISCRERSRNWIS